MGGDPRRERSQGRPHQEVTGERGQDDGIERRHVLLIGLCALGGAAGGWYLLGRSSSEPTGWSMEQVGVRTSSSGEWDQVVTSKHIDLRRREPTEFAVDDESGFRLHNLDTGTSLTAMLRGSGRYTILGANLGIYENNPENGIVADPTIRLYGRDTEVDVPVSIQGDRDIFSARAISTFTVEVIRAGEVTARAGPRPLAIGYGYRAEQSGSTFSITRHPSVDPQWIANMRIETDEGTVTTTVPNEAGTETFELRLDRLQLPPGSYGWQLDLYERAVYNQYGGGDYSRAIASLKSHGRMADQFTIR